MKKLALEDVKNLYEYELVREDFRKRLMAAKEARRVALGPEMTVMFENRFTVLSQIQEMCRVERIAKPEKVQDEIDVYADLIPGDGELSATLFIEITSEADVKPRLDRLLGLSDGHRLWLELSGRKVFARFGADQSREDRIAAVQYLRFPVGDSEAVRETLASGAAPVLLRVDHPHYEASTELSKATRLALAGDLSE
jgi:hypothetical protein